MSNEKKVKIVKDGYNMIAQSYVGQRNRFVNLNELEEFSSLLPKGSRVLDVGCGGGIPVTKFPINHGYKVTGIDFSESMLKLARQNVLQAEFIIQDMTELDFKDGSFDGLTAFYTLIHVPREKHQGIFENFHKILKPDAVMLIGIGSSAWEETEIYFKTKMFWSHYSPEKSLKLVKNAGFDIIFDRNVTDGSETHYWILARNKK